MTECSRERNIRLVFYLISRYIFLLSTFRKEQYAQRRIQLQMESIGSPNEIIWCNVNPKWNKSNIVICNRTLRRLW